MNENDKHFIKRYKELLNKGYCDCNEMNCIDNNSPRRILNIVNNLQSKIDKAIEYLEEKYSCYAEEDEMQKDELLDILKEEQSKEAKELFEGTMDQLNNLSIFKEDK